MTTAGHKPTIVRTDNRLKNIFIVLLEFLENLCRIRSSELLGEVANRPRHHFVAPATLLAIVSRFCDAGSNSFLSWWAIGGVTQIFPQSMAMILQSVCPAT